MKGSGYRSVWSYINGQYQYQSENIMVRGISKKCDLGIFVSAIFPDRSLQYYFMTFGMLDTFGTHVD